MARWRVLQISVMRVGNPHAPPKDLTAVEREKVCWTNIYPLANAAGNAYAGGLLKTAGWNKCQDLQQTADTMASKQFAFSGDQHNLAIQMALYLNGSFPFGVHFCFPCWTSSMKQRQNETFQSYLLRKALFPEINSPQHSRKANLKLKSTIILY